MCNGYFRNLAKVVLSSRYRKVASSSLSRLVAQAYEGEIWCLCTVTFGQKVPKLNCRPVYYSRLYSNPFWLLSKNPFRTDQNKFHGKKIGFRKFRIRENMLWTRYRNLTNLDDVSNRVVPKPDFVGREDIKLKASVKDHKENMTNFVVRHHKKGRLFFLFIHIKISYMHSCIFRSCKIYILVKKPKSF